MIEGIKEITTEEILTALFKLGFDRIDPVFYTHVLQSIRPIDFKLSKDDLIGEEFKKHVEMDGPIYVLKKEMNHDSLYREKYNEELTFFLEFIDFETIVYKKLETYQLNDSEADKRRFSDREISILKNIQERRKDFDEFEKQYKEIQKMKKEEGLDYIKWLIDFTARQKDNKFYDVDYNYEEQLNEVDIENINKISYLVRAINDYTYYNQVSFDPESIKLKYHDSFIEIGEIHGQGTVCFSKLIKDEQEKTEAIDFLEVVNYFGRIKYNDASFSYETSKEPETYESIINKLIKKYDPPKEIDHNN